MDERAANWTAAEAKAIREQLAKILQSDLFAQGQRQSRFLSYVVEETLSGQPEKLNQFLVGIEVFDRDESFDPSSEAIVRVEAGRLRSKLTEYYAGMGKNDPIVIALPKGGYAASIQMQAGRNATTASVTQQSTARPNAIIALLLGGLLAGSLYVGFFPDTVYRTGGRLKQL